jgi:hypothetical protein
MFEEPLLAPPALRNDVLRVLACYAFWFKGVCVCVCVCVCACPPGPS